MSQSNSNPPSPSPSLPSKLTTSLQAARRGESPTPSTPTRRTQGILTPTARKQALRDFYNLDRSKPTSSVTDLDREDFDGKDYVDKLVRERNLATLIMMENDLVQDIRNLDGERKSLVYDNYNKLIAATETIRKMRTHLDPLDPNQSTLRPSIQRIAELSVSLNPIEDNHDTNSLAEKVRWAIQSPERIRQLVRDGNRERAEADVGRLKLVMQNWENVKDSQELLNQCKAALAFGE